MSFDTYTNLQTELLNYLRRTSDTVAAARCPGWITLAEDEIRMQLFNLRVRQGEVVNQAFDVATEYVALPADFFRIRSIFLQGDPKKTLDYVPPNVADRFDTFTENAKPDEYTIQGNQIRFFPPPDADYTATLTYWGLTSLSASNQTNWLLSAHPKIYFRAALAEAFDYYQNEEKRQAFEADRDRMLNLIYMSDGSDQQGTALRMRVDNGNP